MFDDIYRGRRVLLTGDTGFKGSWLRQWLERLGANIRGYSLVPETEPSHFRALGYTPREDENILDLSHLRSVFEEFRPEMVFHLAAQALVRRSYREPLATFATNTMGTVHLLEACRTVPGVQAVVIVTSDKCYENMERRTGYRETDPMGGYDPYSVSKGAAELVVAAWRRSFFGDSNGPLVATARAGNVVGGGDWSEDRLVPDLMKNAAYQIPTIIRKPGAIRPWQHVLEPLAGYLLLGSLLYQKKAEFADAWNFGPDDDGITVLNAAKMLQASWPAICFNSTSSEDQPHETGQLFLNCSKSKSLLKWKPVWNATVTFEKTARWYNHFYSNGSVLTNRDMDDFFVDAADAIWMKK